MSLILTVFAILFCTLNKALDHLSPQWASWSFEGRIDVQIARPNYSGATFSTFKWRFLGMDWKKNRTMNWSVYNLQLAPCTKEEKPFQYICDSVYTLLEFVCLFFFGDLSRWCMSVTNRSSSDISKTFV